jgi:multiple sugar transport system permease protein
MLAWAILGLNALLFAFILLQGFLSTSGRGNAVARLGRMARKALLYQVLIVTAATMLLPFYWMIITAFKDTETSQASPPHWLPVVKEYKAPAPGTSEPVPVRTVGVRRNEKDPVRVVPLSEVTFSADMSRGFPVHRELWDKAKEFDVAPDLLSQDLALSFSLRNFLLAWYRPEEATRGQANFTRYFFVSIVVAVVATLGTLITGAMAAFAFARLDFYGKDVLFWIVVATLMVPGEALLIPNFLILSKLGWIDTWAALIVPWLASVFTIFLMRQFFMQLPDDLWEAARIDGAGRVRFLVQVVVPLSKPVFITAGLLNFLGSWNSLLWPLIVTNRPDMRTLMVGLRNFTEDAGTDFQLLMAASTMAILPVVILFFFVQRFFIEGIARTGLK